ncbi:uncharacterized protein LOC113788407 [Dermatophagoides pteronyssinus]|uniref:uncharacterized protein LOC113788407 n=1 Tax=Dermatophagoides pteronyssinus TaxID=6956 RepID=UPI003F666120
MKFLKSLITLIFYTFCCWLSYGIDHRSMIMVETMENYQSFAEEVPYKNLMKRCETMDKFKRKDIFQQKVDIKNDCNYTRYTEDLRTFIQMSMCLVKKELQLKMDDKSKRNFGRIRSHHNHNHHHHHNRYRQFKHKLLPTTTTTTRTLNRQINDYFDDGGANKYRQQYNSNDNNGGGGGQSLAELYDQVHNSDGQTTTTSSAVLFRNPKYSSSSSLLNNYNQNPYNKRSAPALYKDIFQNMTHHLNQLSTFQENYAMGKNPTMQRLDKMEQLEQILHGLKRDILLKLINIAKCERFKHDCQLLQPNITTTDDTQASSRFLARYKTILTHYIDDLKNSLSYLLKLAGSSETPEDKLALCG